MSELAERTGVGGEVLVLWDLDQTLVDAAGVGRAAWNMAFQRVSGRAPVGDVPMAGRTDRAIAIDMLRSNGIGDAEEHLEALRAAAEAALDEVAHVLVARGRALPGAIEALLALGGQPVVQSLLTGNVRRFAEVKLAAFGMLDYLDLEIGGYGWTHQVRAHLVDVARTAARQRHGVHFPGRSTVLVGDTPLDVEAALVSGASMVAVATGGYGMDELVAAGAHVVLPDLSSTLDVVAAVRAAPLFP